MIPKACKHQTCCEECALQKEKDKLQRSEFIKKLRNLVRQSTSIGNIAIKAGIGRESLYKSLSNNADPRISTVLKLANALGLSLELKQRDSTFSTN